MRGLLVRIVLAWLLASALAPYLHLDTWTAGILLTYPPRLVYAVLGLGLAVWAMRRHAHGMTAIAGIASVLLVGTLGWGGATLRAWQPGPGRSDAQAGVRANAAARSTSARTADGSTELTIIAFNVHNKPAVAEALAGLVDDEHVDILSLQEVRLNNRKRFAKSLPQFAFFWPDRAKFPARSTGVFASMIGIRRDRLDREDQVEIATAITGYRTFAVRASIGGQRLWIVDVHATKPFWLEDGWMAMLAGAPGKARWHHDERDLLVKWLSANDDAPQIVAGDFNAPLYSYNLRLPGLHDAHLDVGRGPHLTVPAVFPIWGIDHVLGDRRIRFSEYKVFTAGPSDHRAQLARFQVDTGREPAR